MPMLFDSASAWMEAVELRNELPMDCRGTISENRFKYNLDFIRFVKSNGFSSDSSHMLAYFLDNWEYDNGM